MKTTSLIPPALLITGLLLSGCSGLDDPDVINPPDPDFDGTYEIDIFPPLNDPNGCTYAIGGIMQINDGAVTGNATDFNTGETIDFSPEGSVNSDSDDPDYGFINGKLVFSFDNRTGEYIGLMKADSNFSEGTWEDDLGCTGTWFTEKN